MQQGASRGLHNLLANIFNNCLSLLLLAQKVSDYTGNTLVLNLNSVNLLIFVMVKCGVLFEVRTEFLNNI
jgi:hypothetical protein